MARIWHVTHQGTESYFVQDDVQAFVVRPGSIEEEAYTESDTIGYDDTRRQPIVVLRNPRAPDYIEEYLAKRSSGKTFRRLADTDESAVSAARRLLGR